MASFYYYDQNPSGFCFLVQVRTSSLGLPNLNMKGKTKTNLVVVVKWRHLSNGLLSTPKLQRLIISYKTDQEYCLNICFYSIKFMNLTIKTLTKHYQLLSYTLTTVARTQWMKIYLSNKLDMHVSYNRVLRLISVLTLTMFLNYPS